MGFAAPIKNQDNMWKLINNFLSDYDNLVRRRLRASSECPLGKQQPEDAAHLIGLCGDLHQICLQLGVVPSVAVSSTSLWRMVSTRFPKLRQASQTTNLYIILRYLVSDK